MAKVPFSKLGLKVTISTTPLKINDDITLDVVSYLPQAEKAEFTQWVLENAIDQNTGVFSPIRLETYFALAIAKWYAGVSFTDKQMENAPKIYDALESNKIFAAIIEKIPEDEFNFINKCVADSADDIAKFNSSLAGMISGMNLDATNLNGQLSEILQKVQNKEGLEELSAIRDIMGRAE